MGLTEVDAGQLGELLQGDVTELSRLLGGASRETWSFRLEGRPLVLRRDPPGAPRGGGMRREAALLRAAAAAGVAVPSVVADGDDFLVLEWLDGETIPRRILRDDRYDDARSRLVEQCAEALARLHGGVQSGVVEGLPHETDPFVGLRETLDRLGEPHPALELGLARLASSRPPANDDRVLHGDFRLGNWMVDAKGLAGVLDWELAHIGDPAEDLGWMCVRSWRFGGPLPVAGIGTREQLLEDYASAGGAVIDVPTLQWWEAYGTLRWGVICVQQAAAHLSGAVRSVELAAIGRRVCEVELDLLALVAPDAVVAAVSRPTPEGAPVHGPHDRPSADELLEAVGEWVGGLALTGRDAFLARVAGRALDVVRRELALGPALAAAHAERLADLGVGSDAELAARIRSGRADEAVDEAVAGAVVDKLQVADPAHLSDICPPM